jgi:hypothetical protein
MSSARFVRVFCKLRPWLCIGMLAGVSNFDISELRELIAFATIRPQVVQVSEQFMPDERGCSNPGPPFLSVCFGMAELLCSLPCHRVPSTMYVPWHFFCSQCRAWVVVFCHCIAAVMRQLFLLSSIRSTSLDVNRYIWIHLTKPWKCAGFAYGMDVRCAQRRSSSFSCIYGQRLFAKESIIVNGVPS